MRCRFRWLTSVPFGPTDTGNNGPHAIAATLYTQTEVAEEPRNCPPNNSGHPFQTSFSSVRFCLARGISQHWKRECPRSKAKKMNSDCVIESPTKEGKSWKNKWETSRVIFPTKKISEPSYTLSLLKCSSEVQSDFRRLRAGCLTSAWKEKVSAVFIFLKLKKPDLVGGWKKR